MYRTSYQFATGCTSAGCQVTKGETGNEPIDELECSAAVSRMAGPDSCIAVGPHTIKELLHKEERVGMEKYWRKLTGMCLAKFLMGGYNLTKFKS